MRCALRSAGCEDGTVTCEESLLLTLQCEVVARRSCSWTARVQHTRTRPARQAWLAHGAFKFYRCERSYNVSLRQLPPRVVRVLLVYIYIYISNVIFPKTRCLDLQQLLVAKNAMGKRSAAAGDDPPGGWAIPEMKDFKEEIIGDQSKRRLSWTILI